MNRSDVASGRLVVRMPRDIAAVSVERLPGVAPARAVRHLQRPLRGDTGTSRPRPGGGERRTTLP